MRVLKVEGGFPLNGSVDISGAKNSVVALLAASILSNGVVKIEDVPELSDVDALIAMIEEVGGHVERNVTTITINSENMVYTPLIEGAVQKLRASYYLMGAMLGRFKKATIGVPGGCYLGPRPIDLHIRGFQALGATVTNEGGGYHLEAEKLTGARINLDTASVGATINIVFAAVYAEGTTYIENAAKEPEIIDVATLLNNMGAKITGAGTDLIRIEGVERLDGCVHQIIPDRIEAGTYMLAAALMGEEVRINNIIVEHMEAFLAKLREAGVPMEFGDDYLIIRKADELVATNLKTMVYPGFATDLQQPFTVLLTQAKGTSVVNETIYTARFKHVNELVKMGANIRQEAATAVVVGPTDLQATTVEASDLRAGAALVLAGLIADGITEIQNIEHIERGYDRIIEKLSNLGAKLWVEEV